MYDKPKVTIDLQEYLDLKEKAKDNMSLTELEVGQLVFIQPEGGPENNYSVTSRQVSKGGVVYTLNHRLRIYLPDWSLVKK